MLKKFGLRGSFIVVIGILLSAFWRPWLLIILCFHVLLRLMAAAFDVDHHQFALFFRCAQPRELT